jgi:hypothetical protein
MSSNEADGIIKAYWDGVTKDLESIGTWFEVNEVHITGVTSQESNYDSAQSLFKTFSGYQLAAKDNNVLIAEEMVRLTELLGMFIETDLNISESF